MLVKKLHFLVIYDVFGKNITLKNVGLIKFRLHNNRHENNGDSSRPKLGRKDIYNLYLHKWVINFTQTVTKISHNFRKHKTYLWQHFCMILVFTTFWVFTRAQNCIDGWRYFNKNCYRVVIEREKFLNAESQ